MSAEHETLRRAFRTQVPTAADDQACLPAEEIWDAAHGRLDPAGTRRVVHQVAVNPAAAEVWRLAVSLGDGDAARQPRDEHHGSPTLARGTGGRGLWLALAATVLAAFGLWRLVTVPATVDGPIAVNREVPAEAIESLVDDGAVLPRQDFVLRWSPADEGARYDLRLRTLSLASVAEVFDLDRASHRVDETHFSDLPDGSALLWQVVLHRPDGTTLTSPTFRVVLGADHRNDPGQHVSGSSEEDP